MCQYQRVFEQSTTVNNNKTKDIRNIKRDSWDVTRLQTKIDKWVIEISSK